MGCAVRERQGLIWPIDVASGWKKEGQGGRQKVIMGCSKILFSEDWDILRGVREVVTMERGDWIYIFRKCWEISRVQIWV